MKTDELQDALRGRVHCEYCEKRRKYGECPMVHYDEHAGEMYDMALDGGYCDRGIVSWDAVGKKFDEYLKEKGERNETVHEG